MIDELRENLQVATVRSTAGAQSAHSEPRTAEATRTRMRKAEDRKAAELRERGWVCFRQDDPDPVDLHVLDAQVDIAHIDGDSITFWCGACCKDVEVIKGFEDPPVRTMSRLIAAMFEHLRDCSPGRSA